MATFDRARRLAGSLLCSPVFWSHAQSDDMPLFDGRWIVTVPAGPSASRQAEMKLDGFGGTWRYTDRAQARKDPCKGQRMPVTLQVSRADRLELTVWGSAVAPSCADLSLVLTPGPAGTTAHRPASRPARSDNTATQLAGEVNGTPGVLARQQLTRAP